MTDSEISILVAETEDYARLISEKNYLRQKFMLYFRSTIRPGVSLQSVLGAFDLAFDVNNAAGEQLDVIGSCVGVNRTLSHAPSEGGLDMDDEEYRTMIRMKIAQNVWDGTNKGAMQTYREVFGDSFSFVQLDNQDMTVSLSVSGDVSTRQVEILTYTKSLLVPTGVGFTFTVNGSEVELDLSTDFVASGTLQLEGVTAD